MDVATKMTGRWDNRRHRWITAREDFADLARKGGKTIEENLRIFKECAGLGNEGVALFAQQMLAELKLEGME